MKLAVIDLGTNTFKLLVASRSPDGPMCIHHKEEVPVNLGRGGIEKGVIAEDAFSRGLEALKKMHAEALALGAERIQGFGTSALRSSRNGGDFIRRAKEDIGIDITIIRGEEEAALVLDGVRQAVAFGSKPMLVMDIGGGSTEFILATDRSLMWKHSFELGTTRLLERFPAIDPMGMETQLRMAQHIDAQLEALWSVVDRHWPTTLVGSAGSFDSLATMIAAHRGTTVDDDDATLQFNSAEFDAVKDELFAMTRTERLAVNGLPDFRADTIIPALMLIERVLLHGITELRWSRYSLKEGAASRMLV